MARTQATTYGARSPRSGVQIFTSCWQDSAWISLPANAQLLYIMIASAPIPRDSTPDEWEALSPHDGRWVAKAKAELVAAGALVDDLGQWPHICTNRCLTTKPSRPYIPPSLRRAVYDRDGWACLACGATDGLTLDHIVPFSLGGEDTYENFQTLCRPCNSRKGAGVP